MRQRRRAAQLGESEIMTIMIYFHQMRLRDCKTYNTQFVQGHLHHEFPTLVSYNIKLKANMKNRLILLADKLLLRRCSILETINDQLKNISQIEHTRYRSLANFMVNLVCGLIACCHQPKKPGLALDLPQLETVIAN